MSHLLRINYIWGYCKYFVPLKQVLKSVLLSAQQDTVWKYSSGSAAKEKQESTVEYMLIFNDRIARGTLKVQVLNSKLLLNLLFFIILFLFFYFYSFLEKALKKLTYMFKINLDKFDGLQLQMIWSLREFFFLDVLLIVTTTKTLESEKKKSTFN